MIFRVNKTEDNQLQMKHQDYMDIKTFGKEIGLKDDYSANEKDLEELITTMIGEEIFQDYLVIGNERKYQPEADIYAINEEGDLVLFELKVHGHYDRGKVLQVMDYASKYSRWDYERMNDFFKKSQVYKKIYGGKKELEEVFKEKFPDGVGKEKFNRKQKMIIVSNYSDKDISSAISYWQDRGIDIEEYFYRFYKIGDEFLFEVSNDTFAIQDSQHCWINTNKTYFPEACREMIKEGKASAHADRKEVITDTMKGGYIFLYHNGYGIIGAGIATNQITTFYNENLDVFEKKIILKNFIHGCDENFEIKKHISPAELKEEFNQSFYFANTKVTLSEEKSKKLYELCKKKFK